MHGARRKEGSVRGENGKFDCWLAQRKSQLRFVGNARAPFRWTHQTVIAKRMRFCCSNVWIKLDPKAQNYTLATKRNGTFGEIIKLQKRNANRGHNLFSLISATHWILFVLEVCGQRATSCRMKFDAAHLKNAIEIITKRFVVSKIAIFSGYYELAVRKIILSRMFVEIFRNINIALS